MSHRSFHPPAVRTSQSGVSQVTSTPRRFAISMATSMSKPSYSPVSGFSSDWGGYAGSVETRISPSEQICASRSPASVS